VRGIRLSEDDAVVSLNIAVEGGELLVVTEHGYGKRTPLEEYPTHGRGGGGVITANVTEKTGRIATARIITERDNDLMIISAGGVVLRTDVNSIRRAGRATQGVSVMNPSGGDTVVAVATTNGKKPASQEDNGSELEESERLTDVQDENGFEPEESETTEEALEENGSEVDELS